MMTTQEADALKRWAMKAMGYANGALYRYEDENAPGDPIPKPVAYKAARSAREAGDIFARLGAMLQKRAPSWDAIRARGGGG